MKTNRPAPVMTHLTIDGEMKKSPRYNRRFRRYGKRVERQNFAARHGYRFWNLIFNLF